MSHAFEMEEEHQSLAGGEGRKPAPSGFNPGCDKQTFIVRLQLRRSGKEREGAGRGGGGPWRGKLRTSG